MSEPKPHESSSPDSAEPHPMVEVLAKQFEAVIHVGLRASALKERGDVADLLLLSCLDPPTAVPDEDYERALRLVRVLRRILKDLRQREEDLAIGLGRLLGSTDHSSTTSVGERRRFAARLLQGREMTSEGFRKGPEKKYCQLLAEYLIAFDEENRQRVTRNRMELGAPADPAVAIDWLDRFQYYYGIWSCLSGLRFDIDAIRIRRQDDPESAALEKYAESSLCYWGLAFHRLDRFVIERGGLWLLSDADLEQELAAVIYKINWHPPLSTYDVGWIAHNMTGEGEGEIVHFRRSLSQEETGRDILQRWTRWLATCNCGDVLDETCEPHQVVKLCYRYIEIIDAEWYKIASWYTRPPDKPFSEQIDLEGLYQAYSYRLDEYQDDQESNQI
jgi:hypothetical protein